MQRLRPAPLRLVAKPLPKRSVPRETEAKSWPRPKLVVAPTDYSARALKVLASIMAYGAESARIAAAKVILQNEKKRKAHEEKPVPQMPVIYYVISGEEPPLGPEDYDTSLVGPEQPGDEMARY